MLEWRVGGGSRKKVKAKDEVRKTQKREGRRRGESIELVEGCRDTPNVLFI